ncbi:MAG TPA: trehalose-phosphatase, partial [Myxococcota bacterium]|nr:trehalose-phosphatase [Myxococcota bacterium]
MQQLTASVDLERRMQVAANAPQRLLMLDYDGTLAPFQVDPALALPYPGLTDLLERLAGQGTRIVVVTGRPADQCERLLAVRFPLEIWGCHGGERRLPDGSAWRHELSALQAVGLLRATAIKQAVQALGGRLEIKRLAVAAHHRGCPAQAVHAIRALVRGDWQALARQFDLSVVEFDGGLELRLPGLGKAHAVEVMLAEAPTALPIAFLGDDETDEDGFRAVRGRGLGVLVRPELRPTAADLWIQPPEELFWFL